MRYNSIKAAGSKVIEDVTINIGAFPKLNKYFGNKMFVLKAIADKNLPLMREISEFYYRTNGIYQRVCDYFAYLYRYDWYIVPEIFDDRKNEKLVEKVLSDFDKILEYLDNSHIKQLCNTIALESIIYGSYYGYIIPSKHGLILQQLPSNYCRTIYSLNGCLPVVELDMRFFDEQFRDANYRMKVLKLFPKDIQKGYMLYKTGKLSLEHEPYFSPKDTYPNMMGTGRIVATGAKYSSWYTLDPACTVRFSLNRAEQPLFINAIPAILDLDQAQDLDRKKQLQQLLKIVIQQLPLDKNGDLIFDVDEARDIHSNAVEMLSNAVGVDVLTTFADVKVAELADTTAGNAKDDLDRMERAVYLQLGISRNLFNTDGNLSLEKSILNDEAVMKNLILQFNTFFDTIVKSLGRNKNKYTYRFHMLETTQYNYKELSKTYKEQVQIGYSKMLPQIALGHSQSSIIHTAYFENQILELSQIMIPPLMSSTMSATELLGNKNQSNGSKSQNNTEGNSSEVKVMQTNKGEAGRPEKSDDQKSEKTI